jgi:GNAT superfamily N-acetyltransferase
MAASRFDRQHFRSLGLTERQIGGIFEAAAGEAAAIGASLHDFDPARPFAFADYPQTKARIEKALKTLRKRTEAVVVNGINSAWTLSNNKNNALCDRVFGDKKHKLTKEQERRYYSNNDRAREAFLGRKTAGLNLSDRVWNCTSQFKAEIEMGIDLGLRDQLNAHEMARDLKQYLRQPDKLFRRVRDEHGILHLSKAAKAYHPGAGVYRSSYKNAFRLARTETNMAYRTSDHERWQQLDFVVGVEIRLSNNHTLNGRPFTDICDDLKGKYPKDFKFTGWHPACRCFAVPVLKTEQEMLDDSEGSANTVKDMPENFKEWAAKNADRIAAAEKRGTLPYFLKDNARFVNAKNGKGIEAPYVMTEKGLSELRASGFSVDFPQHRMTDVEFTEKFNAGNMKGFNIPEFDRDLENTLRRYDPHMEITAKGIMYYDHIDAYQLRYSGRIDGKSFSLVRSFKPDNTVEHNLFTLPESAQGKGLSKAIFRDLYKQYKNAGVETVKVHANLNVGGYTWSKYGFTADKSEYGSLLSWAKNNKEISADDCSDFLQWLSGYKGKDIPVYEVAYGKKYGKKLLKGSDWQGYINFSDAKTKEIFEKYIISS